MTRSKVQWLNESKFLYGLHLDELVNSKWYNVLGWMWSLRNQNWSVKNQLVIFLSFCPVAFKEELKNSILTFPLKFLFVGRPLGFRSMIAAFSSYIMGFLLSLLSFISELLLKQWMPGI